MNLLLVIIVFVCSTYLFKIAAGTLSPLKLNIISLLYYFILVFQFIGGSIVYLGFRNHYLINKISNILTIAPTYYALCYTMIIIPIVIIVLNYLFRKRANSRQSYLDFLNRKTITIESEKKLFISMLILTFVSTISVIYVFNCIGYVPFVEMIKGNLDLSIERINVSRHFAGNEYVRNIIMLGITPLLSYVSYVMWRTSHKRKWLLLFCFLFPLTILVKTYDFSKAPVVYYLFYFYFIEILLGNLRLKRIFIITLVGLGIIVILFYYLLFGYNDTFLSLSHGPISRILITQVATLFLHFDAFPAKHTFLCGESFPGIFTKLFNLSNSNIRSGRVVTEIYSKEAVSNGTAGVMNTLFIGEAYANFGIAGVILAPILFGIVVGIVFNLVISSKKNIFTLILYLAITMNYITLLLGGFVEIIYNVMLIIQVLLILLMFIYQKGFRNSCDSLMKTVNRKKITN